MKLKYNKILAIISVCVVLFGAIFIGVGVIVGIVRKTQEKNCTYKITATVLDNERGSNDSSALYPVYYYSYLGKEYTVKSSSGSYPPKFSVGEEVEMYIDPDDPKRYFVPVDNTTKIISIVFKIIGSVIAALGLLIPMIIAHINYKKSEDSNEYAGYPKSDEDYISTVEEYNRYE